MKAPDINLLPNTVDLVDDYILSFGSLMKSNYQTYQQSVKLPYSFMVQDVSVEGDSITVNWDRGLNGEDVLFKAALYRDAACINLVAESEDLIGNTYTFGELESREYYIHVTAINDNGKQISRSLFISQFGKYCYGVSLAVVL